MRHSRHVPRQRDPGFVSLPHLVFVVKCTKPNDDVYTQKKGGREGEGEGGTGKEWKEGL